ncbi:MAG: oligosaccharide flippase family protein [bacterium]
MIKTINLMIIKVKEKITTLLRQSQKYTRTDNVYLFKYGSYLTLGDLVSLASAFVLSLVFARWLPKEVFGQYQYLLAIFTILAICSLEGMNNAIIQGVARGLEGAFGQGLRIRLKWGLLGSLAALGVGFYFWLQNNTTFALALLIIAFFLPFFKAGETFQSYLTGKKLFGQRAAYTATIQVLASIAIVMAIFLTRNLLVLILTYFAAYCLLRLIATFWLIKKMRPNRAVDPQVLNYGKHLSLMGVLNIIAGQIDKILLFFFLGPTQLAIYSFASLPIQYLRGPLQNIQELAWPQLATRSGEEIKKTLPKKLLKSCVLILLLIGAYVMAAPFFYKLFYPQYADAIPYSQVLSFNLLVFPMSMMTLALAAKMKTKELYQSSIINPLAKIILFLIFVPLYGIWGVVIAILLNQVLYFFLATYLFKKIA